MKQTFGEYIREKRIQRMMKLNTFAARIGISAVYASYIETGKRPAPSEKIIEKIAIILMLTPEETAYLCSLAASSHKKVSLSEDLIDYINSNPSICDALRAARDNKVPESMWIEFTESIINSLQQKTSIK